MAYNMSQSPFMGPWTESNTMRDNHAPLAIARVVLQSQITQVYSPHDGLKRGTIFPELDKPFLGKRGAF